MPVALFDVKFEHHIFPPNVARITIRLVFSTAKSENQDGGDGRCPGERCVACACCTALLHIALAENSTACTAGVDSLAWRHPLVQGMPNRVELPRGGIVSRDELHTAWYRKAPEATRGWGRALSVFSRASGGQIVTVSL